MSPRGRGGRSRSHEHITASLTTKLQLYAELDKYDGPFAVSFDMIVVNRFESQATSDEMGEAFKSMDVVDD